MTTKQIYKDFLAPKSLQEHMLRVAALVEIIAQSWTGPKINKKQIVVGCLFHDIAKPMTFDLAKQAQFGMKPPDIKKLEKLQQKLKKDFGSNEHHATLQICKNLGLDNAAVKIVDNFEWAYIPRLLDMKDYASLLAIYADMRIGPKGIFSLHKRLAELKNRVGEKDYQNNVKNGESLEQEIQKYVSMDLQTINNSLIEENFDKLLNIQVV